MVWWIWLLFALSLSGCVTQPSADKIFSNAQVRYDFDEDKNALKNKREMEMPSYFLELEYETAQTELSPAQVNKINAMIGKIVYPEEYKLYISFGAGGNKGEVKSLASVFKRAQDIRNKCKNKGVKNIKIVYLKNQKPDCVYLRLIK